MRIETKNGEQLLFGENVDLKIDTKRIVSARCSGDRRFKSTPLIVPEGYKSDNKIQYLIKLNTAIDEKWDNEMKDSIKDKDDTHDDSEYDKQGGEK
jgi:hypothetical protein